MVVVRQQLQIPPVGRDDKGSVVTSRKFGDLDGRSWEQLLGSNCRSLPLVGMTKGVWLLLGSLTTRMDGVGSSYSLEPGLPIPITGSQGESPGGSAVATDSAESSGRAGC